MAAESTPASAPGWDSSEGPPEDPRQGAPENPMASPWLKKNNYFFSGPLGPWWGPGRAGARGRTDGNQRTFIPTRPGASWKPDGVSQNETGSQLELVPARVTRPGASRGHSAASTRSGDAPTHPSPSVTPAPSICGQSSSVGCVCPT